MNKLSEIFQSWVASFNPTSEQELIAKHRMSVCDSCEKKTHVLAADIYVCGACGCPLSKKIFSPKPGPEACPLAKWEK